jgi:hypothetical protein
MESKKINQLATELSPALEDLTIIGDPTTGISKKITLSQMASLFTGTVEEYANFAAFPLVGVADTIYIALDTNVLYRWNTGTSAYVELSPNIINSLVFSDANGFDGNISLVGSVATLTITTALTTGSVGFIGASGALLEDNTNFFWNNSTKRLGINTNAPTTALDVFGSGIIGRINGTTTNNAFLGFASAGINKWSIGNVQSDHRFRIYSEANSAELVSVLQTGEFGIGIANPLTKFHIFGGASALIANLDANTSVAKSISYRSGNSSRINLEVSGTESGTNAGMDFFLRTYADAGSLLETPFSIVRSTGVTTIKSLTLTNVLSVANGGTGSTTQNFVDLTTAQSIAGAKTFTTSLGIGAAPSPHAFYVEKTIADYVAHIYQTGGATASYGGLKVQTSSTAATTLLISNAGTTRFSVIGDGTTYLNGALGIGQSTPKGALHIGANLFDNTDAAYINLKQTSTTATTGIYLERSGERKGYYIYIGGGADSLTFQRNNAGSKANTLSLTRDGDMTWDAANTSLKTFWTGAYGGAIQFLGDNSTSTRYARIGIVDSTGSWLGGVHITSAQNVGFGTSTPSGKLHAVGVSTSAGDNVIYLENAVAGICLKIRNDKAFFAQGVYDFTSSGGTAVYVDTSGNLYRFTSSLRYKRDVVDYTNGLTELLKIQPKFYKSKNSKEGEKIFAGLIAEQIDEIGLNEFVEYNNEGQPDAVHYSAMTALLVKAIQEQQVQIEELKALINK